MQQANIISKAYSGNTTFERSNTRVGFAVCPTTAQVTIKVGGGNGAIPVPVGRFWEPRVCPIGEITIESTGDYIVVAREGEIQVSGRTDVPASTKTILNTTFARTIAFGDSITASGGGARDTVTQQITLISNGYWVPAIWNVDMQLYMLDNAGTSGDQTSDLLARMSDVTGTNAELVLLMIGTNDLNAGRTPEETRDNMRQILDQLTAANKAVLITPVSHRNVAHGLNASIDTLNGYYRELAEGYDTVVVGDDHTEFNALVDAGSHLEVTTDGLHPNAKGAYLLSKSTTAALNKHVVSLDGYDPVADSIVNDFSTPGGNLYSGATGESPLGWSLYRADPSNGGAGAELGGVLDTVVGTWRLKSGTTQGAKNYKDVYARSVSTDIPAGVTHFIAEADVHINNPQDLDTLMQIYIAFSGGTGGAKESIASLRLPLASDSIPNNRTRIKVPYQVAGDSTRVALYTRFTAKEGASVEVTLSNMRLIPVGAP